MAQSIKTWIKRHLHTHHRQHGADLGVICNGSHLAQLTAFHSYRDADDPQRKIYATISDSTHYLQVGFDTERTTQLERSLAGELPDTLTSHLRSIICVKAFRIELLPPPFDASIELAGVPTVRLDILDWAIVGGNRFDPVFYPLAEEVGFGNDDEDIRPVLRKWYSGAGPSDVSQNAMDAPSRARGRSSAHSMTPVPVSRDGRPQDLDDFLQPHIKAYDTKHPKQIPAYIFDPPSAQDRAILDRITVFGIDVAGAETAETAVAGPSRAPAGPSYAASAESLLSAAPSRTSASTSSPYRPFESLSDASVPGQVPSDFEPEEHVNDGANDTLSDDEEDELDADPVSYIVDGQMLPPPLPVAPRPPTPQQPAPKRSPPKRPREDGSDDEPMKIKPLANAPQRGRRRKYDAFRQPTPPPPILSPDSPEPKVAPSSDAAEGGDTDEDELSDYERERRKRAKGKGKAVDEEEETGTSASLSQSQDSATFTLARYTSQVTQEERVAVVIDTEQHILVSTTDIPSQSQPRPPGVLVSTTEESAPQADEAVSAPAVLGPSSTVEAARKRPRDSSGQASALADDEQSLQRLGRSKRMRRGTASPRAPTAQGSRVPDTSPPSPLPAQPASSAPQGQPASSGSASLLERMNPLKWGWLGGRRGDGATQAEEAVEEEEGSEEEDQLEDRAGAVVEDDELDMEQDELDAEEDELEAEESVLVTTAQSLPLSPRITISRPTTPSRPTDSSGSVFGTRPGASPNQLSPNAFSLTQPPPAAQVARSSRSLPAETPVRPAQAVPPATSPRRREATRPSCATPVTAATSPVAKGTRPRADIPPTPTSHRAPEVVPAEARASTPRSSRAGVPSTATPPPAGQHMFTRSVPAETPQRDGARHALATSPRQRVVVESVVRREVAVTCEQVSGGPTATPVKAVASMVSAERSSPEASKGSPKTPAKAHATPNKAGAKAEPLSPAWAPKSPGPATVKPATPASAAKPVVSPAQAARPVTPASAVKPVVAPAVARPVPAWSEPAPAASPAAKQAAPTPAQPPKPLATSDLARPGWVPAATPLTAPKPKRKYDLTVTNGLTRAQVLAMAAKAREAREAAEAKSRRRSLKRESMSVRPE